MPKGCAREITEESATNAVAGDLHQESFYLSDGQKDSG